MKTTTLTTIFLATLPALLATTTEAHAQAPTKLTLGVYAPSVEFGSSTARLGYAQALGKSIEQATGISVEAKSYANLAALKKDNVDFAIIDGPCYATNLGWKLLATALINGGTSRGYALYSSAGNNLLAVKGKKLAFVQTGCNDAGFIDNAMLESELEASFFGARIGKPDVSAAVAEVASLRTAQAVFAPTSAGGVGKLTKVFDTGTVPNPAFVGVNAKLPQAVVDKAAAAVSSYGGGGAISGWSKPVRELYTGLASRLGRVVKSGVFAAPDTVRLDARDVLLEPPTLKETALVGVRQHFVRPPGERMN